MAFTGLLPHVVYVSRRPINQDPVPAGALDRLGMQVEADDSDPDTFDPSYPCRMAVNKGGKQNNERMEQVFENRWMIFLDPGCDIREDDIVTVFDANGNLLLERGRVQSRYDVAGSIEVHHVELDVWQQTGPGNGPGL